MSALLLCLLISGCGGGSATDAEARLTLLSQGEPVASQVALGAGMQTTSAGTDAQATPDAYPDDERGARNAESTLVALAANEADPVADSVDALRVASAPQDRSTEPMMLQGIGGLSEPGAGEPADQTARVLAQSGPLLNADGGSRAGQVLQGLPLAAPGATESSADALAEPARGVVAPNRLAREDWPGLPARIRQTPAAATFVASQQRLVDAWSARNRDRADLIGGWVHDYVDPRSGIPLVWKEDSPEPVSGNSPDDDRIKEAWVAYMRQRNMAYVLAAARIYRATGERRYAEWAMGQLDFYATNYARWPLSTADGRAHMFRTGLTEATSAFVLVEAARLLADAAGPARERNWMLNLFRPMAENLKLTAYPMTNVGLWHQAAVAAIAMRARDDALLAYALDSAQGIRAIIAYGMTADFLWIEGSFDYNGYVIECLARLLVHASLEGYAARFAPEWIVARRLLLSPIDYRFDDGTLPVAGDTTVRPKAVDLDIHRNLYRLVPSYWGVERARAGTSWDTLLDPPVAFPNGEPALPNATTRNFPSVRMAVLRAGAWQAYVHYGQAVGTHAQEEALTFELHDGKTPISAGSGTVSYSSPYHTRYFRRGAAHNVPLIDGVGQAKWEKGSIVDFSHRDSRLVVSQPDYNRAASAEREYRVTASGFVETTRIALKGVAPQPARLGEAFHTDCAVEPGVGLAPAPGLQLPGADPLTFWKVRSRHTAAGPWSVHLKCDGRTYRLGVTGSGAQRVFLATAPTTPLPAQTNVVYYDTTSTDTTFRVEITALP